MNEKQIQWAVDELEIRNVLASLTLLSDMGDIEDWGMLFTEDADYTTATGSGWHGREAIVESGRERRARGTHGPGSNNKHLERVGPGSLDRPGHRRGRVLSRHVQGSGP